MDDVTSKRLDLVQGSIDALRDEVSAVGKHLGGLETRVEQVHGMTQLFRDEVLGRLAEQREEQRTHHAAQMKAFQEVIGEVRAARDQRMADLEAAVAALRAELAEIRAKLAAARSQ